MTTAAATAVVLARHPTARLTQSLEGYYGLCAGDVRLADGYLSPRGAWNAAAEAIAPGCTSPVEGTNALFDHKLLRAKREKERSRS